MKTTQEQNNLISKLIVLGSALGTTPQIVPKASVFPKTQAGVYTAHERQSLIALLSTAQTYHGAHHYRDSEDDYERNLWAMRSAELSTQIERLKTDRKATGLLDTLIDAECWLCEAQAYSAYDSELTKAISTLSRRIHKEIAGYYFKMN